MKEGYKQGVQAGKNAPNFGMKVRAIYNLAFQLGYKEGSEEFNKFLEGYASGYVQTKLVEKEGEK